MTDAISDQELSEVVEQLPPVSSVMQRLLSVLTVLTGLVLLRL